MTTTDEFSHVNNHPTGVAAVEPTYEPRFQLIEGSTSGHCCFEFTIEDRAKPDMRASGGTERMVDSDGRPKFQPVCECFDRESAERLVNALNAWRQS